MPRYLSPNALCLPAPESSNSALCANSGSFMQTLKKAHTELLSAHDGEVASLRAHNQRLENRLQAAKRQANSNSSFQCTPAALSYPSCESSVPRDTDGIEHSLGSPESGLTSEDGFRFRMPSGISVSSRKRSVEFEDEYVDGSSTDQTKQAKGDDEPAEQEALAAMRQDHQAHSSQQASQAAELNASLLPLQKEPLARVGVPDDLPDPYMLQNGMTTDAVRLGPPIQLRPGPLVQAPRYSSEGLSAYSGQSGLRQLPGSVETALRVSGSSRTSMRTSGDWTLGASIASLDGRNSRPQSQRNSLCSIDESMGTSPSASASMRVATTHERSINRAHSASMDKVNEKEGFDAERVSMFGGTKDAEMQSVGTGTSVESAFEVLNVWAADESEPSRGNSKNSSPGQGGMRTKSSKKRWTKKLAATISNEDIIALAQRAVYEEVGTATCFRHIISYPSSRLRLMWDVMGMVFVLHDVIMIPLSAFNVQDYEGSKRLNLLMLVFWTLDIPASLTVGYLWKTKVIMHPVLIATRYLRTWFLIDIGVLTVEWSILIAKSLATSSGGKENAESFSLLRTFRIFRTIRLVRFLKLQKVFRRIQDMIHTEYIAVLCDIVKLLLLLVLLSHLMACGWYAVGRSSQGNQADNWIDQLAFVDTVYMYTSSLHWSLTQFTPASMDVQPRNVPERVYAIAVLLAGLLVFSGMVSSITSSLVQLRKMSEDDTKQLWMLRRYLSERTVPPLLSARIHQYLEHMLDRGAKHVQEESVTILRLLSSGLRSELQYTIKTRHVVAHALFDHISKVTNATMFRLTDAMFRTLMACADTLFFQGEESHAMYFVVCGEMRYVQDECLLASHNQAKRTKLLLNQKEVRADSWMCEPGLWTTWVHLGDLHALVECDLITIDSGKFREVMVQNPPVRGMVSQYARAFVRQLNMLQDSLLNDLCDCLDYDHLRKNMEAWMHGEDPPDLAPNPGIHREERKTVSKAKSMTKSLSMSMKSFSMKTLSMTNVSKLKATLSLTSLSSMLFTTPKSADEQPDSESDVSDSPASPASPKQTHSALRRSATDTSGQSSIAAGIIGFAGCTAGSGVSGDFGDVSSQVAGCASSQVGGMASSQLAGIATKSVGFEEHCV